MKNDNKKTGNKGEDLAVGFLENKGYLIVERNFRTRFGEIDIVCLDGQILVFVEVKTKIGHTFGEPEDMVSKVKLAQVRRTGEVFIELNCLETRSAPKPCSHASTSLRSEGVSARGFGLPFCVSPSLSQKWKGQCRVDVVGVVLKENGEVEIMRHHEAVY